MLKLKKSLGQNFLIDKNIIKKIIKLDNIENQIIIENFILNNPRFSIVRQKNYYPSEIGDGFYCAELLKNI